MGFWKREFELFLDDLDNMVDFLMQPVYLFGNAPTEKLKPSNEEIIDKSAEEGFWQNEWSLFLKDLDSIADFLVPPDKLNQ